eukprot:PhM_4_TR184/c0_g1_i1/m.5744
MELGAATTLPCARCHTMGCNVRCTSCPRYFCSQRCFTLDWETHRTAHPLKALTPNATPLLGDDDEGKNNDMMMASTSHDVNFWCVRLPDAPTHQLAVVFSVGLFFALGSCVGMGLARGLAIR